MADTVSILKIPDINYTWQTYPNTWVGSGIADTWVAASPISWSADVSVSLTTTEATGKGITKGSFNENLSFTEQLNKAYVMQQYESLSVLEVFSRVYNIVKVFNESFSIVEQDSKNIIIPIEEVFSFLEFLNRKASATFSDITIFNNPVTLTEFQDLVDSGSPAGYNQFKKFLPGDYSYRYAKVKAILNTLSNDTPVLDNLKVIVDVADIRNKGTATIVSAASGINVVYNTPYNSGNPNVILAFKGGIGGVATPEISNESLTGFTVKLINQSGTYVTGSVSWASDGY